MMQAPVDFNACLGNKKSRSKLREGLPHRCCLNRGRGLDVGARCLCRQQGRGAKNAGDCVTLPRVYLGT